MADWVRHGKVGRPTYDDLTKEIRANPKATSDVTREVNILAIFHNNKFKAHLVTVN